MQCEHNLLPASHVKISQLVASLYTSRQQVVFALLVPSCHQVWNNLLTTCNIVADFVRLVTSLIQQICYNHNITILLQPCFVNLETFLLYRYHSYYQLYRICSNNLVTSLIMSSSLLQVVNSLFQTCSNKHGTSSANTSC